MSLSLSRRPSAVGSLLLLPSAPHSALKQNSFSTELFFFYPATSVSLCWFIHPPLFSLSPGEDPCSLTRTNWLQTEHHTTERAQERGRMRRSPSPFGEESELGTSKWPRDDLFLALTVQRAPRTGGMEAEPTGANQVTDQSTARSQRPPPFRNKGKGRGRERR